MKIAIVTLIAMFLFLPASHAKCPLSKAVISGTVVDAQKKTAIANAQLLFFFDEANQYRPKGYASSEQEFFKTESNGSFKATAFYDTFSSSFFGSDQCGSVPKIMTVIIIAPGYTAQRFKHRIKDNEIVPESETLEIHLQNLQLK